ncbi:MAG: hypothetical protein JWR40_2480 [Massilia sp.]|jgi:hypothetical protein|nr:hypothetical protein [Massilia sp.]MDB5952956.1 hypothetical protein [Massilia sp.]
MASRNEGNKQSGTQGASQGGGTKNRGFASMDPARQREIASQGGKAAHQKGTAHEFTSEEARRAGSMSHGNRQSAAASSGGSTATASTGTAGSKRASAKRASGEGGGNKQSEQGGSRGGGEEAGGGEAKASASGASKKSR